MTKTSKWILGIVAVIAVVGIGGIIAFFFAIGSAFSPDEDTFEISSGSGSGQVALIKIEDVIVSSEDAIRQLRKYAKRSSVKAIVLHVNTPGGGVVPSQEIYEQVHEIVTRDSIPVVVSMGSVAASGGYYIACGATTIMANKGTITGSIGVISQYTNIQPLLKKIGVETKTIKSGKFKDIGSPSRPMTPEEEQALQQTINNVYGQFVDVVVQGRSLSEDSVRTLADGRIYSGEQAFQLGLVDTLGTLRDAIRLAGSLGGIEGEPRIIKERKQQPLIDQILGTEAQKSISGLHSQLNQLQPLEYRLSF